MAFVARTTRDSNRVGFAQQAGGDLGPGSYSIPTSLRTARPAFTAFGSTTGRSNLGAAGSGVAFVTPGPGTYRTPGIGAVRRQRNSMYRSKQSRFGSNTKKNKNAPGPGSYSVKSSFKVSRKKMLPQASRQEQNTNGLGSGLGSAPVTWVRVASAPSIPAPSQSYGYEEGKYGELIMQKAPTNGFSGKRGDQAGPGAYNIRTELGGKKVRSVDWARSQTTRTDFTRNSEDAPGPGQYQNIQPQTDPNGMEAMERSGTSSFASKSSRLQGGNSKGKSKRKKKEQRPGPGQYRVKGAFVVKYVPENLQFFGSTERRFDFKTKMSSKPGPGAYNVGTAAPMDGGNDNNPALRNPAAAGVGFTSTSSRFSAAATRAQFGPDPGTYEQSNTMIHEMNKKLVSRTGVFGSTTRRFAEIGQSNNDDQPSPTSNLLDAHSSVLSGGNSSTLPGAISGRPRRQVPLQRSAAFASKTQRGQDMDAAAAQAPPPGTYNVKKSWTTGGGGKGVLGSGSQRFKHKSADNEVGPGAYHNPQSYIKQSAGTTESWATGEKRFDFRTKMSQEPGPGSYNPEYLYGNMNKRTFNMTIAEQEALA